jgi:hypothetical protein
MFLALWGLGGLDSSAPRVQEPRLKALGIEERENAFVIRQRFAYAALALDSKR